MRAYIEVAEDALLASDGTGARLVHGADGLPREALVDLLADARALHLIHGILDGQEWNADTLDAVARILASRSLIIRDCNEPDTTDRGTTT